MDANLAHQRLRDAYSKGLAVAFWRFHTHAEEVQALEAAVRAAFEITKEPVGLIQVAPSTASTPDSRARSALGSMLRQLNGFVSHSAIVHEAEGFRAALIRSIVTGIVSISNPGFPHRVFASVADAAAWMSQSSKLLKSVPITTIVARVRAAIVDR